MGILLTLAPVGLLYILTLLFPPWHDEHEPQPGAAH
jgi:hypothetical protein